MSRWNERTPDEASYLCEVCGERIVIPIDLSAGHEQEYVEDCPVCCNPNLIHVRLGSHGETEVSARSE